MTSQFLTSELTTLLGESKRKNAELKQAVEASLAEIKGIQQTSEKQIALDLSRRPQFINPFVIACASKNPKFATIGMSCLQRLAVTQGLPKGRLKDVVEAITECTSLSMDIQLKILQTLPSLVQNYAEQVGGNTLFTTLQICSALQTSKAPSVSGTSAATLQQLIASLYDKLAAEDKKLTELPVVTEIPVGDGKVPLRAVAYDAFRVFHDLCMLIEGSKPEFIRFSTTSEASLLEIIESIIAGHATSINEHPEQAQLVKGVLIPYLIKAFSEKPTFQIGVRATRVLFLIIRNYIPIFPTECETIFEWFHHTLDSDSAPAWKRILCMEVYREIFADSTLVLQIHSHFDGENEKKAVITDTLASFVRLASEKPALIGLGQQSSIPIGHYFQRDNSGDQDQQGGSSAGAFTAGVPTIAVPGISTQFSSIKTPCIEQLDKQDPPNTPETYVYSLVLSSLNNLSESLAKFILPLTVPSIEKPKKKLKVPEENGRDEGEGDRPSSSLSDSGLDRKRSLKKATVNPLTLKEHKSYESIKTASRLIDQSWPAILACCSTFFNAALDTENYRTLVRLFQKFTQISGLLHMSVPRDAFLTTLGKSAMPPNLVTAGNPTSAGDKPSTPSFLANAKGLLSVESIVSQASSFLPDRRRPSLDGGEPTLNVRNLLCLRALLNLAIALGSTLEKSWRIILETLQQADRVLASLGRDKFTSSLTGDSSVAQQIGSEITAVQAAASRLFESTIDLPDDAFMLFLTSLCGLVDIKTQKPLPVPGVSSPPMPSSPAPHRRVSSFSGLSVKTGNHEHDYFFNLTKLREVASLNLERFILSSNDDASGWNVLNGHLTSAATSSEVPSNARALAVDIVRQLVMDCVSFKIADEDAREVIIISKVLLPLSRLASVLQKQGRQSGTDEANVEAHFIVLETLRGILEHAGDNISNGWATVFDIIQSSFFNSSTRAELISVQNGRSAFSSLQLICSDFLSERLRSTMNILIDLLYNFASQEQDINISLTTTTFFWNLSDFLYAALAQDVLADIAKEKQLTIKNLENVKEEGAHKANSYSVAIWFYLLKRLTDLIRDTRHEVRNGAVQTIFRIFDNHGDDLSPLVWKLCLDTIVTLMITNDIESYNMILTENPVDDEIDIIQERVGTSRLLLQGLGKLLADYQAPIKDAPDFIDFWKALVQFLSQYLGHQLHELTAAVWQGYQTIISKPASVTEFPLPPVEMVYEVWLTQRPKPKSIISSSNIVAFEAYSDVFAHLHKFMKPTMNQKTTTKTVENFEACIHDSDHPTYTSDMDSVTPLQASVIRGIKLLRTDIPTATSLILGFLGRNIELPFEVVESERKGGLSFIAFSKSSMDVIETLTQENANWPEIIQSDSLELILANLSRSVALKYQWQRQGRSPPLWQKASVTSRSILERAIPKMFKLNLKAEDQERHWKSIVSISANIAHARFKPDHDLTDEEAETDERLDIDNLTTLNKLMIPSLGDSDISDLLRRNYCRSLLTASLIHSPQPQEIKDLDTDPLGALYETRSGRTYDPEASIRSQMSYFAFQSLLFLLKHHDSTPAQVRLAKAAAPYVILRAALPLKNYIADQPLRGLLPMPESMVLELVTVLRSLRELRCEPDAIPPTQTTDDSVMAGEGRHLIRLYPLVVEAAEIQTGPLEVRNELTEWMVALGAELGLP